MTNYDCIIDFVTGKKTYGAVNHIGYQLNKLWNYSTVLCEIDRENKTARVNARKYSRTTSKIQDLIRSALINNGFEIVNYIGESANYWNYGYMGAARYTKSDFAI